MKHTLSVLVEDESGALSRISGLFARRGFNIESLAVGPAEKAGISRLTMVVAGDDHTLEQMTKQLDKLINVLGVIDLSHIPAVERELMLLKVSAPAETRSAILDLVQVFRANVVDVADDALTLEVVGDPGKLVAPGFSASVTSTATGGLAGSVVADADGSVVVGARVAAQRVTGASTVVEIASLPTGPDGSFAFTAMPAGPYRLVVTAPGFVDRAVDAAGTVVPGTDLDLDPVLLEGREGSITLPITLADPSVGDGGDASPITVTAVAVHDRDRAVSAEMAAAPDGSTVEVDLNGLVAPAVHRITITAPGHRERTLDVALAAAGEILVDGARAYRDALVPLLPQ